MNIDLMSFTAHKIYGPKGIGSLYARRRRPRVRPSPIIHGGGHERGIRSGTLNVPGVVGFAAALEIAGEHITDEGERLRRITDTMYTELLGLIDGLERNGHPTRRLPHNLNVFIPNVDSKGLILEMRDVIAISSGSACSVASIEPSHVIAALGFNEARAHSSVRFGLGRFTTTQDVKSAIKMLAQTVDNIRRQFSHE